MRGPFIFAERRWLWSGALAVAGLVTALVAGGSPRARATVAEGRSDEVEATARALVSQLEARLRSTEASLEKARAVVAELEGKASRPAPITAPAPAPQLRPGDGKDLEGVWRLVGIRNGEGETFTKAPYEQYKIMTADHYLWMSFEPETGKVLRSGGGSYTLKDGTYSAHVDYSNSEDLRAIAGQDYTFTCKLDGNLWYHAGPMPNGARVDDLWERINVHKVPVAVLGHPR